MSITAMDGEIGHAETFYFDDERWAIRYLVVDTTSWLGRQVLISPISILRLDPDTSTLLLSTTREQIRHGSSEHRKGAHRQVDQPAEFGVDGDRARLRSTREVIGYHVQAPDGELGRVDDFLVDDATWAIRYAIVDASNWWLSSKVPIAVEWIDDVSWSDRNVSVELTRQAVKGAPAYDPETQIDNQWETQYFTYYQGHGRWQTAGLASPGLVSLKQHGEFAVDAADADPRGWKVVSSADGRTIGKVDDLIADPRTMKVRYLDIDLEADLREELPPVQRGHILLPVAYARLNSHDACVTAEGLRTEDVARLPKYDTLPIPLEYDEHFRTLLRGFRAPDAFSEMSGGEP